MRGLSPPNERSLVLNDYVHHHHYHNHLEPGVFYLSTLTCNQENPTRCNLLREVRLERCHASRRRTEIRVCRIAVTLDNAEVGKTSEMDAWTAADACCILVRCSRARRFRSPPPHPVLEKHRRANQPDPSRNPLSHSGLLGYEP